MPIVFMKVSGRISDVELPNIKAGLRPVVAEEISADEADARLKPEDILIWGSRVTEMDEAHDVDLQIVIFAHDYPSRKANLEERRKRIQERMLCESGGRKAYCWIILAPTSYGTFVV